MKAYLNICKSAHLLILLFFCSSVQSQTVTRQLFGSGGGNATPINGTYYVNWSMGEAVINTLNNGLPQLTQGFQQPEIIIPLAAGEIVLQATLREKDVFLSWNDSQRGAIMYQAECLRRGMGWQKIGETSAFMYRHYDVPFEDQEMYYRVVGLGADGSIRHSNTVAIQPGEVGRPDIFPNPATDWIQVKNLTSESHLLLYDMTGKLVHQQKSTGSSTQIQVSDLPAAMYLLYIMQEEKSFSYKIEVR